MTTKKPTTKKPDPAAQYANNYLSGVHIQNNAAPVSPEAAAAMAELARASAAHANASAAHANASAEHARAMVAIANALKGAEAHMNHGIHISNVDRL